MTQLRDALLDAILYAAHLVQLPPGLAGEVLELKTLEYYQRTAERLTRQLYNGEISQDEFENDLLDLMDAQLDRAWREGMRANGLDPEKDTTPAFEAELERIKLEELAHIPDFSAAIVEAAQGDTTAETPRAALPNLYSRAGLWANRYPDVVNQATLFTAEPDDKLVWIYGETEHCRECELLNGIVATAAEWNESGFHPQEPENPALSCGGWKCQCQLIPTNQRLTKDRLERWANISAG